MIKFIKLSLLSFLLITYSCQTLDDFESKKFDNEQSKSFAMVDPDTPIGIQPNIVSSINSNNRIAAPPSGNWNLVWSDEFNGSTLDESKWVKSVSTRSRSLSNRDPALKDWRWVADHAYLDGNGELTLKASKTAADTMQCGAVETRNLYEPKYGFIEVRMKIAETAKGNHSAFWFQGHNMDNVDGTGNDGAEIDVFESAWTGDFTKAVVHIDGYGPDKQSNTKRYDTPDLHTGYHTWGLEWDSLSLTIYYDGVEKVSYSGIWVPQVEEWIWLSVGASFGDGDFGSQPIGVLSEAKVDYIRVWQKPDFDPTVDYFRFVNKESGKFIRTAGSADDSYIEQAQLSQNGNWSTWVIEYTTEDYFYIVNEGTGKYFRPVDNSLGAHVQLKPTSFNGAWTQWKLVDAGGGYFHIQNKQTGLNLRVPNTTNSGIPLEMTDTNGGWTKWQLVPAY
jgi:beta-glucanase (GH16 family)